MRAVVKVGTSSITDPRGELDAAALEKLSVDDGPLATHIRYRVLR